MRNVLTPTPAGVHWTLGLVRSGSCVGLPHCVFLNYRGPQIPFPVERCGAPSWVDAGRAKTAPPGHVWRGPGDPHARAGCCKGLSQDSAAFLLVCSLHLNT